MGKLKCKCCIQPKMRQLEKIIKKPHKYSKKYIEEIVDEEFIPELTKKFENLGKCYPSSEILEIFDTVDMGKGVRSKEKLYKGQREDIRETVKLGLLSRAQPVPSFHEVCWSVSGEWLLFSSPRLWVSSR